MIVQVTENIRVESNGLNWDLQKFVMAPDKLKNGEPNPNAGGESWKTLGHYPSFEAVIISTRLKDEVIKHSAKAVVDLTELTTVVRSAAEAIQEAVRFSDNKS